jgi:mono/diheme cytochrome c family protein
MDDQTVFYILGGALVVIAVVLSALGLRLEKFPGTRGIQVGVSVAVGALVVATASFAWMSAEEEQEHREAELAHEAEQNVQEGDTAEALEEEGAEANLEETTTTAAGGETASAEEGAQVFADFQCGGCHTLADAGATGTTGPALDSSLQRKNEDYIRTAIVDPNADVAQGYPPDIMPQDYEQQMDPAQLDALVAYLASQAQ